MTYMSRTTFERDIDRLRSTYKWTVQVLSCSQNLPKVHIHLYSIAMYNNTIQTYTDNSETNTTKKSKPLQIFVPGFHLRPEQVYSIEVFPVPSLLRNLFHEFQPCLLCFYVTEYSYYVKLFRRYCLENTDWLIDRLLDADLFHCQIPRLLQPSPLLLLPFGKYWRQWPAWKHIHKEEVTILMT